MLDSPNIGPGNCKQIHDHLPFLDQLLNLKSHQAEVVQQFSIIVLAFDYRATIQTVGNRVSRLQINVTDRAVDSRGQQNLTEANC